MKEGSNLHDLVKGRPQLSKLVLYRSDIHPDLKWSPVKDLHFQPSVPKTDASALGLTGVSVPERSRTAIPFGYFEF